MRAWMVHEYGPYRERLTLADIPQPVPEGATSVIRVEAAGVMFADMLNIAGTYQLKAPLPFTPGSEAMGTVVEAGPESRFRVGERVAALNLYGAFAEYMVALDSFSFPIPDAMTAAEGAAFTINYQTAYFALQRRARLERGETLLVHGGAGGVGTAAIQIGKWLGARVLATAGSEEKLAICRQCGADSAIDYRKDDFVAQVRVLTEGQGADVIFDPVGGDVFEKSTKCVAFEGRILSIGFASGAWPSLAVNRMLVKNFDVIGLNWGNYQTREPELIQSAQQSLYHGYGEGALRPVICQEFPMEDLIAALARIEGRGSYGKVVLRPDT